MRFTIINYTDNIHYDRLVDINIPDNIWDAWYNKVMQENINRSKTRKGDPMYMYDVDESMELGQITINHFQSMLLWLAENNL